MVGAAHTLQLHLHNNSGKDASRPATNRQSTKHHQMSTSHPHKDSFDVGSGFDQRSSAHMNQQKPHYKGQVAAPQLNLNQNIVQHSTSSEWQSPFNNQKSTQGAKKIKPQMFVQNLSPLAQSISGKGFVEGSTKESGGKSVTQRRVQEVPASSRRFNETQSISMKAANSLNTGGAKSTTVVTKIKKRLVKLSAQNLVDSSTKVLIDLDDINTQSVYRPPAAPQTTTQRNLNFQGALQQQLVQDQVQSQEFGLKQGRRSIQQQSEHITNDSHSNSALGHQNHQRRVKIKSRDQKQHTTRQSKGFTKDLLSLVKSTDFNNTLTISNQRVLPVSTKNQSSHNKSLLKQHQESTQTPYKIQQQTREDTGSNSRRMSQIVQKLQKLKTYQSQVSSQKVSHTHHGGSKDTAAQQQKNQVKWRPPIAIRLQLQDINQSSEQQIFNPHHTQNLMSSKHDQHHLDEERANKRTSSVQKNSSVLSNKQSNKHLNTSQAQVQGTSSSHQSNFIIGMKRGQQSTTNKNAQPMLLQQSTGQMVCSATNRQKKVFNFGEVEDQNTLSAQKYAKMQLMQQLLMNQSQVVQKQQLQQILIQAQKDNTTTATQYLPSELTISSGQGKKAQKSDSIVGQVQSPPHAHAHYFEAAGVNPVHTQNPSTSGNQVTNGKVGSRNRHEDQAHGSTAITTTGGNTVININIASGAPTAPATNPNTSQDQSQTSGNQRLVQERTSQKQNEVATNLANLIQRNLKISNVREGQVQTQQTQDQQQKRNSEKQKINEAKFNKTLVLSGIAQSLTQSTSKAQQKSPNNTSAGQQVVFQKGALQQPQASQSSNSTNGTQQLPQLQQRDSQSTTVPGSTRNRAEPPNCTHSQPVPPETKRYPQSNYQDGNSPPNRAPIQCFVQPEASSKPEDLRVPKAPYVLQQITSQTEPDQDATANIPPTTIQSKVVAQVPVVVAPAPLPPVVQEEPLPEFPLGVRQCLKAYSKSGRMTDYEKTEVLDYDMIYFLGTIGADKKIQGKPGKNHNYGFDDEQGDYTVVLGDHLAFRWEVLDFLGKGSFGQAIKCRDHKTGEIVAVKIIRNKEKFKHQAQVELNIVTHLRDNDPHDQNNIIRIKDSCYFRKHLIISFELFSINLYEFIKANNFRGVPLSLVRRFAIQILQALRFLEQENIIHCDLKPENILLKSQDKSGIKIIDFGSSCFSDQRIYTYIQSRFYRAPEIMLGIPFTTAIDMWSLGCILIELYIGIPIFPGESESEQLSLLMEVIGLPDMSLLEVSSRRANFFEEDTNQLTYDVEDSQGQLRIPGSKPLEEIIGSESASFLDFISKILVWDPTQRMQPLEALEHPWILEGLPKKVLIHHQRMLGMQVPSESCSELNQSQSQMLDDGEHFEEEDLEDYPDDYEEDDQEVQHLSQIQLVNEYSQDLSIERPSNQLDDLMVDDEEGDDYTDIVVLEGQKSKTQPLTQLFKAVGASAGGGKNKVKLQEATAVNPMLYQSNQVPVSAEGDKSQMSNTMNLQKIFAQNLQKPAPNQPETQANQEFGYLLNSKPKVLQKQGQAQFNNYI